MVARTPSGAGGHRLVTARLLLAALSTAALVLGASPALAAASGPVLTLDEQQFLSSRPIVSTETFDEFSTPTEFPTTQRRVVIDGVRYRSVDVAPPWWIVDQEFFTQPTNVLFRRFSNGFETTADLAVAFRDGGSARAIGFRLNPFATNNRFELRVTEADGATTTVALPIGIVGPQYVGLSSPNRIRRVVITQRSDLPGVSLSNFSLDDVSRSAIRR
jgi:hypothetical protein